MVITLGRTTFERIAQGPDDLADVADLSERCDAGVEFFSAAVSNIYTDREGFDDKAFTFLEAEESPSG